MKNLFKLFAIALLALWTLPAYAQTTVTSTQGATDQALFKPLGSGLLAVAHGTYEETTPQVDGDIWQMLRVPKGACIVDGVIRADDLDTGTETLDIDVGWAANGVEPADPDGFGNLGVWTGDAVTGVKPEATVMYRLNGVLKDGPMCFGDDTTIQLEANAASAGGGDGTFNLTVYYYVK
jgi:hypothetical protein